MEFEILDVVVVAKSSYSASFNIPPGMFGGALKACLTTIFGGDSTADELPELVVILRNRILKIPICVLLSVVGNAADYTAVVRHYQTGVRYRSDTGVRIELLSQKERSSPNCGSKMWKRWSRRGVEEGILSAQTKSRIASVSFYNELFFDERQKNEERFDPFLLSIYSRLTSFSNIQTQVRGGIRSQGQI